MMITPPGHTVASARRYTPKPVNAGSAPRQAFVTRAPGRQPHSTRSDMARSEVSSLRTSEWGVSGHRNTRPGRVGGCRRRGWSSPLLSPRAAAGEVARAYGVSQGLGVRGWWPDTAARARRRSSRGRGGRKPRPQRSRPDGGADHRACGRSWPGRAWTPGRRRSAWHLGHHHQIQRVAGDGQPVPGPGRVSHPRTRLSGRSRLTCGSPPSCPTSAGRPTSPTTRSPTAPIPRS